MSSETSELQSAIAEARELAREQVAAAWQIHLDRIREQLESGWREQLDGIFEERFAEVEQRLRDGFASAVTERARRDVDTACSSARIEAAQELSERVNNAARRLHHAESRDVWISTLLELAAGFAGRVALFASVGRVLRLEGISGGAVFEPVEAPADAAPAFSNVLESLDTVVSMATARELSEPIARLLGEQPGRKVYLFPVVVGERAVAVLYAEPGEHPVDVSALELTAVLAASSIQSEVQAPRTRDSNIVRIAGLEPPPAPPKSQGWSSLSKVDQEVHLRAQRFARTQVAQILLYKVQQVKAGRASNALYSTLQKELDAGREEFRRQFIETCPSMADYYHTEVVRSLALDHPERLGADYPGPMV